MPINKKSNVRDDEELCSGGQSFNSRHKTHVKGSDVYCYRCKTRMGCTACVEVSRELICLYCHNWASKHGLKQHGNVMPNAKVQNVNTDDRWRRWTGIGTGYVIESLQRQLTQAEAIERRTESCCDESVVDKTAEEKAREQQRRLDLRNQARGLL